ncbi:MAG: sugar porter family MFS transporter [Proteobacteria bacterium]|nr:sugar porter family MFS transporter [Pseudomonadota bacterium]
MQATDRKALTYAAVIALGGFLFGFDAAVISGVVGFVTPEFGLDDWQIGLVVGAPTLAAIFAALSVGPAADVLGRKKVMLALAFLYALSATASAFAPDVATLIAARLIGGLAFGSLMLAPIYIAELSPARLRGRMVSVNQLNIVIGFSAAYFANYFLLQASQSGEPWVQAIGLDRYAWRWMLGIEVLPAVAWLVSMVFVPESPRWLMLRGRENRARGILEKITPRNRIDAKLSEIAATVAEAPDRLAARIRRVFRPELRLILVIGVVVGISQQISGINSVYFYAPTIFEQSGVGTNAAFAQATWIGIINVIFTVVAMLTIDRFGRRPLMILGLAGVAISMSISAYGFHQARYELPVEAAVELGDQLDLDELRQVAGVRFDNDLEFKGAVAAAIGETALTAHEAKLIGAAIQMNPRIVLVGILGFVASFAISLGPVMWVLFSEIFPNAIRGVCMSVMGVINSGVSFFVQFIFPWELSNLGTATTFLLYAIAAGIFLVLVAWLLPETRGRTLEELESELTALRRPNALRTRASGNG